MRHSATKVSIALLLTLALTPILATPAAAGDDQLELTFGTDFLGTDPPCPVNQLPQLQTVVPVPRILDPFEQDTVFFFCDVLVTRGEKVVKNAKGDFVAELIRQDNRTGMGAVVDSTSGRFKTDSEGFGTFDFDFPSEIFADGFESGDVSAWSYTRTDFRNRKKADSVSAQCVKGASSSSSSEARRQALAARHFTQIRAGAKPRPR